MESYEQWTANVGSSTNGSLGEIPMVPQAIEHGYGTKCN